MAAAASQRTVGHDLTSVSGIRSFGHGRRASNERKKGMWSSMLESVSSGKRLPVKNLIVLGGTPETQREFLNSLSANPSSRRKLADRSKSRQPPIANQFALGYTYQEVLDVDQEDTLARLSIHLLADASPTMAPLLAPLLNSRTLPDLLLVILLDWSQPWLWVRQLRSWIRILRSLLLHLDNESKAVVESNILSQRERGRNAGSDSITITASSTSAEANVTIPFGPGELDEFLGIPICVVCQSADRIEILEKERGWKDEEFDFILQYLRTILLKHGASLVYMMPSMPGEMRALVHSHLGVSSTLSGVSKLKHNIVDRDRVLVPPYWDSWGKIRAMREGFDVEGVSRAWEVDTRVSSITDSISDEADAHGPTDGIAQPDAAPGEEPQGSAVAMYEATIRASTSSFTFSLTFRPKKTDGIDVESLDTQKFLAGQLEELERLKTEEEREKSSLETRMSTSTFAAHSNIGNAVIEEQIGPVQFNMGGIRVDADNMVRRLKDREANRTSDLDTPTVAAAAAAAAAAPAPAAAAAAADGQSENEVLASFFAGLAKRGGGSTTSSPRRDAS